MHSKWNVHYTNVGVCGEKCMLCSHGVHHNNNVVANVKRIKSWCFESKSVSSFSALLTHPPTHFQLPPMDTYCLSVVILSARLIQSCVFGWFAH